jgi:Lipase (class 3)
MEIAHAIAPSYERLRPYKPRTSESFPVYRGLTGKLVVADPHPDPVVAHLTAVCAAYSYSDANTLAMIMARMGLEDNQCLMVAEYVDALLLTSTSFLVQSKDGRVAILCYRGTPPTSLITWLTDFQFQPVKLAIDGPSGAAGVDVHAGFYRNVRSTQYEVIEALQRAIAGESVGPDGGKLQHKLQALYITGHSLGGASAAMMSALLLTERDAYAPIVERLRATYTFGGPMIGSPEFASACDQDDFLRERVIRYVYANDFAPQGPPSQCGPFAHFGQEYQYKPSGDGGEWRHNRHPRKQLRNVVELATMPLSVVAKAFAGTRRIPFHASAEDHLPQYYISALTPPGVRSEFGD